MKLNYRKLTSVINPMQSESFSVASCPFKVIHQGPSCVCLKFGGN